MLHIIKSIRELNFGALMSVYAEGNLENGQDRWPEEPPMRQLQLAEEGFYEYLRYDFFDAPGSFYAVWEEKGKWVSALRMEPFQDGMLLEALETAPEHRGNGYAENLIRSVLDRLEPCKVYSHVGKTNAASLRVHEKCGFCRISERAVYIDGSVNAYCCTLLYEKTREV